MPNLIVVAVADSCVEAFMNPFVVRTREEARRGFTDAVLDPKMEFGKHPEHYALYAIGEFDSQIGLLVPYKEPKIIAYAKDCFPLSSQKYADLSEATDETVRDLRRRRDINGDGSVKSVS